MNLSLQKHIFNLEINSKVYKNSFEVEKLRVYKNFEKLISKVYKKRHRKKIKGLQKRL